MNGLTKDDIVVTAGQLKLRDGAPVTIAGSENMVPVDATPIDAPATATVSRPASQASPAGSKNARITAPPKS